MTSKNIQLVEYNPTYAKAVAEMWNRSDAGWNGIIHNDTEATVLNREANSTHFNIYLALDGSKVVGYCKLSRYDEEPETMYIALLSVDPAYHGQKIGKVLVLKCVERTVELGYPRLDLFTWEGNLKAVPLYKKCGFFWENMERATHLFNFMPTILQNELLTSYFNKFDWYNDSAREIVVEPDGVKQDGYEYYYYQWQKDGEAIKAGFERTGRSLCYLETPDFLIEAVVKEEKPVFGQSYQVEYKIVNKSGNSLEVRIQGCDDDNIKSTFDLSAQVKDSVVLKGDFKVEPKSEDVTEWKTLSGVKAVVTVNGKKSSFKTGLKANYPVSLDLVQSKNYYLKGQQSRFYLNLENQSAQDLSVEIVFPANEILEVKTPLINCSLAKGEKTSIQIPCVVLEGGVYQAQLQFKVTDSSGQQTVYTESSYMGIYLPDALNFAETKKHFYLCSGKWYLIVYKSGEFHSANYNSVLTDGGCWFAAPLTGTPYSSELKNQQPEKYEFFREPNAVGVKVFCKTACGLEFWYVYRLSGSGNLEFWFEKIQNNSATEQKLALPFGFSDWKAYYHANGKTVAYSNIENEAFSQDEVILDSIDENWFYTIMPGNSTTAIIWPEECKLFFADWHFGAEFVVQPGETAKTSSVQFLQNTFASWQELREVYLNRTDLALTEEINILDLEVNGADPLKSGLSSIELKRYDNSPLKGSLEFKVNDQIVESVTIPEKSEILATGITAELPVQFPVRVSAQIDYTSCTRTLSKAVFPALNQNKDFKYIQNGNCLTVDNGLIAISSDSDFAPVFHSLQHEGREWLQTTYPTPAAFQWWNPFFGGIKIFSGQKNSQQAKEKWQVEPVKLADNHGQLWQGIKIELEFKELEKMRGWKVTQYALLLPDRPLMAFFAVIENQTGEYQRRAGISFEIFTRPDADLKKCLLQSEDEHGNWQQYRAGFAEVQNWQSGKNKSALFSAEGVEKRLQLFSTASTENSSLNYFTNNELLVVGINSSSCVPDHETRISPPTFAFFTKEAYKSEELADLKNIRFEV